MLAIRNTSLALAAVAIACTGSAALVRADETPLPDDVVLTEQLHRAIDLRRREDFDRMLDARDPGELVEHATLTDIDFDYRKLGIDTLFIVGDELFALSVPSGERLGRQRPPRRRDRLHAEASRACTTAPPAVPTRSRARNCHSKGGPDGAGTQTQNAFLRGDGVSVDSADQRNPPHMLGLGPIELLAREMSVELAREAADAAGDRARSRTAARRAAARRQGRLVRHASPRFPTAASTTQAVAGRGRRSGRSALRLEGASGDASRHDRGVAADPSGPDLQAHPARRCKDGTLDGAPYGNGPWYDVDEDGVSLEIDSGMLTTVVGYLAQLEVPVMRPPRDPGLLDMFAAGSARASTAIGCAGCHVPTLKLDRPESRRRRRHRRDQAAVRDQRREGRRRSEGGAECTPSPDTPYLVHLFSDLKRHDMGQALASPAPQGAIPARMFLTRPLWGLAETAPYLHDGRAPTVHDAIVLHGGEAAAARDAYLALDENGRAERARLPRVAVAPAEVVRAMKRGNVSIAVGASLLFVQVAACERAEPVQADRPHGTELCAPRSAGAAQPRSRARSLPRGRGRHELRLREAAAPGALPA